MRSTAYPDTLSSGYGNPLIKMNDLSSPRSVVRQLGASFSIPTHSELGTHNTMCHSLIFLTRIWKRVVGRSRYKDQNFVPSALSAKFEAENITLPVRAVVQYRVCMSNGLTSNGGAWLSVAPFSAQRARTLLAYFHLPIEAPSFRFV